MGKQHDTDRLFEGSVPEIYDKYLVPLIFEPYAEDLAHRVAARQPARVLEIAAGTGVVTRHLSKSLPSTCTIVATDLNQPMLDQAAAVGTMRPVEWQQADAMQLPFPDASFDVVACQFGVMFFPDKARAYAETRRVLRPGGVYIFNAWDRIEQNEFADIVTRALATLFPADPPRFMARIPHGYHEPVVIRHDLACGGFDRLAEVTTVAARSRADSPHVPAVAYCQGTPLRGEIAARGASRVIEATDAAADAIAQRFGAGTLEGRIQAHIIAVER
ncbi:MAG: methyltransferase domain-containing protein [Burkholderiaceae bacterium]